MSAAAGCTASASKCQPLIVSSLPAKIQFPGTAVVNDRIYVIGGCNEEFQAYDSVYEGIIKEKSE